MEANTVYRIPYFMLYFEQMEDETKKKSKKNDI